MKTIMCLRLLVTPVLSKNLLENQFRLRFGANAHCSTMSAPKPRRVAVLQDAGAGNGNDGVEVVLDDALGLSDEEDESDEILDEANEVEI